MFELDGLQILSWMNGVFWPMTRIAGMLLIAPIFSSKSLPIRMRILLVIILTVIIVPMQPQLAPVDPFSPASVLITLQQLLIGIAIGFSVQLVFGALILAGQATAMGMGLGFASMVDPQNGVQVPVIGQYYVVIASLLFLGMNGHLAMIRLLNDSFEFIPVGIDALSRFNFETIAYWGSRLFTHALQVALPTVIAILLVNLSFGVVSRTAPQLNIFGVGFPIVILLGFLAIIFSIGGLAPKVTHMVNDSFTAVTSLAEGKGR